MPLLSWLAVWSLAAVPTDSLPPAHSVAELKTQVESILTRYRIPGVGMALVTRDSVLWAGGVGFADLRAHRPVTAETHFRVGSISKTFVALALLKLAEEGKTRLDATVKEVAPDIEIHNRWEATDPVRIANLLEHTAGFDDMHFDETYNFHDRPDLPMRDVLAINPKSRTVRWRPGTRFSYSNPGYGVAGYLIEKISGTPYDAFIKSAVFDSLGMSTASFVLTPADSLVLAQGYDAPGDSTPTGWPQIYHRPAGNLHTSPRELAQLVRLFLNRGMIDGRRFLSEASVQRMEHPATTELAKHGVPVGYGLANYYTLGLPITVHGHDGGIEGFLSNYAYSADLGLGWVLLFNTTAAGAGFEEIQRAVVSFLLGQVGRPAPPLPVARVPLSNPESVVGYYRDASPRAALFRIMADFAGGVKISLHNDTLYHTPARAKGEALIPTAPGVFRLASETEGNRSFFTVDGASVYATASSYYERSNALWFYGPRAFLLIALIVVGSGVLVAVVTAVARLLGKGRKAAGSAALGLPILATICLAGAVVLVPSLMGPHAAERNLKTVGFAVLTVLFAILAVLGLLRSLRLGASVSSGRRTYLILLNLVVVLVAVYLGSYGFIGLRTWAY